MKYLVMFTVLMIGSSAYAGECVNGSCRNFRNKIVNVTQEIISVPVVVTRKTVDVTRQLGRKTVNRVRNIVR
jgi:hypothetical protein